MGESRTGMECDVLILAIDTSGETCSIAISDDSVCRVEYNFRHERRLIERIPGIVQSVLTDTGLTLSDIEAFAVGLGPGSFTGVRVGVTLAKVWSMTLDKPVVGVSSLDALAEPLAFIGLPLACVAPTRKTESVVAFYSGGMWEPISPPQVLANDIIAPTAREIIGDFKSELLIVGEIAHTIMNVSPKGTDLQGTALVRSSEASAVARLALHRLSRGESDDTDSLVPLYVTPPPTG
ncbi:MAG: tRNA (adenosine(37)-N6)-threonylcarbamoyltransferase complex dimerization subunit type 1 TsaB [Fibrella sp.]|nr:tRNA (adenosine(37)-N6)-threonylcarbamoyltransferase complex dimerization subunit type 1 TsaB [Armatimonadota bacterium]